MSVSSVTSTAATKEETITKVVATLATEEEVVVIALEMLIHNQVMIQVMIKVMEAVLTKTIVVKGVSEEVMIIEGIIVVIVEVEETMGVREWETITNKNTQAPMARAMGTNVPSELRAATEVEAGAKIDMKHGY